MNLKSIKNNKFIFSIIEMISCILPKRVIYPQNYFYLQKLCKLEEEKDGRLDLILRKALCNILVNSLLYVPHYRNLRLDIDVKNIIPDNVYEALKKFPYLSKREIMKDPSNFLSENYKKSKSIYTVTSGGSTGQGVKVYRNIKQYFGTKAFIDYFWQKVGYKRTSKTIEICADAMKKKDTHPFSVIYNKLLISPYHFNRKWIELIFNRIKKFKTHYIHTYPFSFEYLVRYMYNNKLELEGIQGIFLSSERVNISLLKITNEVLPGVPILLHYGLAECTNFAIGKYLEKENKIIYKIVKSYSYNENYIHEDGRCEIVGTNYWNDIMPLIRYRTQDFGKIENGYIYRLDGREQEFLITKEGEKIPGFSINIDQFTWDYVEIFQIVQNKIGEIEFHIKPKDNYNKDIESKILESHRKKWGGFFDISIVLKNDIKKTPSGKLRLVVNNIL